MAKTVDKVGDCVGPYGHKIISRWRENNRTYCEFECGWCHNPDTHFINRLDYIKDKKNSKVSCGCQDERLRKEKAEKLADFNRKNAGKPRPWQRKYNPGDIIGKNNNILFVKELDPRITGIEQKTIRRAGIFKNLDNGKIFESTIENVQNGNATGNDISCGEAKIEKILKQMQIKYIKQKRFSDCIDILPLPFDFYLPEYNCCIEYDGLGHFNYNENSEWRTKDNLIKTKEHDNIKNKYCKNNNIKLIRIPYTEYDNITEDFLKGMI